MFVAFMFVAFMFVAFMFVALVTARSLWSRQVQHAGHRFALALRCPVSPGEGDVPRIGPSPPCQAGRIASKLFSIGFQQRYATRRVSSKPVAPAPSSEQNPPHSTLNPKLREEADRPGIADPAG